MTDWLGVEMELFILYFDHAGCQIFLNLFLDTRYQTYKIIQAKLCLLVEVTLRIRKASNWYYFILVLVVQNIVACQVRIFILRVRLHFRTLFDLCHKMMKLTNSTEKPKDVMLS